MVETIFIPTLLNSKINIKEINNFKLPKEIAIFYSIQYKTQANQIKKILSKNHIITKFSQTLGCSTHKISQNTKVILLISNGRFHAISLAIQSKIPVYIYNLSKLEQISNKEIKDYQNKKKGAYLNYLNSGKIGILISTKPTQQNFNQAIKINITNKNQYYFLANNINIQEFENFPQIKSWINTACPRMDMNSSKIINIKDVEQ